MSYLPTFQYTADMISLVSEITELATSLDADPHVYPNPHVRRANQIRSVHSSTWIEGNTLTLDEVTAVIDGRRVIAPKQQILEVRQAFAAYEALDEMDPTSFVDLLKAHGIMMEGITSDAGQLRRVEVGVYSGFQLVHAGTPAAELLMAMDELFSWLKNSNDHPLIRGCFFHCAFEGIHPFSDGNGRVGRLWHSLINRQWKPELTWAPIESMVAENQREYYHVLGFSNTGDATLFIEFMLEMTRDALMDLMMRNDTKGLAVPPSTPQEPPRIDNLVKDLLAILGDNELSASELMGALNLSDRKHFRVAYLRPALDAGLIELTIPDKPSSPRQKYRRA